MDPTQPVLCKNIQFIEAPYPPFENNLRSYRSSNSKNSSIDDRLSKL